MIITRNGEANGVLLDIVEQEQQHWAKAAIKLLALRAGFSAPGFRPQRSRH
ncbi:MAG: hypothetical protein IIZ92_11105 [Aquincola sp.]|nr:hypothetical protein [Aquincola sp.]